MKSCEEVATVAHRKVIAVVQEMLPLPNCPLKKQETRFRREEAIKLTVNKLGGNAGITVEVKP